MIINQAQVMVCYVIIVLSYGTDKQWRLVVKLAGRAARFHLRLNMWDCRPGSLYN